MATGAPPLAHGILSALDIRPDGGGVQPIGAESWQAPPIWNTLAAAGVATVAVAAPGSSPATHWPGLVIDDRFAAPPPDGAADWPLPPRCINPPHLRNALRPLRLHPAELDPATCAGLPAAIPAFALAEAVSVQAAALHLLQHEPWQAAIVVHRLAARAGDAAFPFLDAALGHLIAAAGPGATVLVASPAGLLIAAGPGIPADELRHGLAPADVAATILAHFGLHAPGGQPLTPPLGTLRRPAAWRPPAPHAPTLPPGSADAERAVAAVQLAGAKARAAIQLAAGDHATALATLAPLADRHPNDLDLLLLLGQGQILSRHWPACLHLGARLDRLAPTLPWGAMLTGAAHALAGDHAAAAPVLADAEARSQAHPAALIRLGSIALHLANWADARRHYRAALALTPGSPDAHAGLGLACIGTGDLPAAETHLCRSLAARFHAPALHHQLGLLYASQLRWREATASVRTALAQQPDLPEAKALLRQIESAALQSVLSRAA